MPAGKRFENIMDPSRYSHFPAHTGTLQISEAACEWYHKTRYHLLPMDSNMASILNFVESSPEPLNSMSLNHLASTLMLDFDIAHLAAAMFGFMNGVLSGEAHTILRTVVDANGLEVWRLVTKNITNRSVTRRNTLLKSISRVTPAKHLQYMMVKLRE